MKINFILAEMTFFRYFAPVSLYLKDRGHQSCFVVRGNQKYNSPLLKNNYRDVSDFCEENNFLIATSPPEADVTFLVEGVRAEDKKGLTFSFTYQTDFLHLYKKYVNKIDFAIFPSEYIKEFYGLGNEGKILSFGSPKFCVELSKDKIYRKYSLNHNTKKALVIWPKPRDLNKVDMSMIFQSIKNSGYEILVKTRAKDPVPSNLRGDHYFEDYSWFPHTTCELLKISDVAINFGSTAIEECVMYETPVLNFDIKPDIRHGHRLKHRVGFEFLYENTSVEVNNNNFQEALLTIDQVEFDFARTKRRFLQDPAQFMESLYSFMIKNI